MEKRARWFSMEEKRNGITWYARKWHTGKVRIFSGNKWSTGDFLTPEQCRVRFALLGPLSDERDKEVEKKLMDNMNY